MPPPTGALPEYIPKKRDPSLDYKMYNIGQGQIAVSTEGFQDPYQVAVDAHLLVSRRNDLVRLYNPAIRRTAIQVLIRSTRSGSSKFLIILPIPPVSSPSG